MIKITNLLILKQAMGYMGDDEDAKCLDHFVSQDRKYLEINYFSTD